MKEFIVMILIMQLLGFITAALHLSMSSYPRNVEYKPFVDVLQLIVNILIAFWCIFLLKIV
jgi:hypothetical protein